MTRWERFCAALMHLGAFFPYWLIVDFLVQVLLGRLSFGAIIAPAGPGTLMPAALAPFLGLIITALVYLGARHRSEFVAFHAMQAFIFGIVVLVVWYGRGFVVEAVGRAFADSNHVLECATGPGCTVHSIVETGFGLALLLLRMSGFAGMVASAWGRRFQYPLIGPFCSRLLVRE